MSGVRGIRSVVDVDVGGACERCVEEGDGAYGRLKSVFFMNKHIHARIFVNHAARRRSLRDYGQ